MYFAHVQLMANAVEEQLHRIEALKETIDENPTAPHLQPSLSKLIQPDDRGKALPAVLDLAKVWVEERHGRPKRKTSIGLCCSFSCETHRPAW